MQLPELEIIRPNFTAVYLRGPGGTVKVWFSYATAVGFTINGGPRIVRHNEWSRTTGRHLNEIDGGLDRFDGARFAELLGAALNEVYGLTVDGTRPDPRGPAPLEVRS